MSRPELSERKQQIGARVAPKIKAAIAALAGVERRTESQIIEILLEESPRLKSQIQKNGKGK